MLKSYTSLNAVGSAFMAKGTINKSGTRKEDLLLDKDEHKKIVEIRRAVATKDEKDAMADFINYLS